jgi:phage shock protein B
VAITLTELMLGAIIVGLMIKMMQSGRRANTAAAGRDELKVIEDIQLGLARLEQRVEALETLLLDRQHKGA